MSDRLLKESDVLRIAFQLPLVVNSAFADAVKALPSADRLQGEWIVNISDYKSVCSVCGANETHFIYGRDMWYGLGKSKFCPYCGAKMKGVDDDQTHDR